MKYCNSVKFENDHHGLFGSSFFAGLKFELKTINPAKWHNVSEEQRNRSLQCFVGRFWNVQRTRTTAEMTCRRIRTRVKMTCGSWSEHWNYSRHDCYQYEQETSECDENEDDDLSLSRFAEFPPLEAPTRPPRIRGVRVWKRYSIPKVSPGIISGI